MHGDYQLFSGDLRDKRRKQRMGEAAKPTTACLDAEVVPAADPRRSRNRRGSLPEAMTASELAAARSGNVEQLCRLTLTEFNDSEKLALRRRAGGGLLESTQTDNSRA
jgi:hypothetical protein